MQIMLEGMNCAVRSGVVEQQMYLLK